VEVTIVTLVANVHPELSVDCLPLLLKLHGIDGETEAENSREAWQSQTSQVGLADSKPNTLCKYVGGHRKGQGINTSACKLFVCSALPRYSGLGWDPEHFAYSDRNYTHTTLLCVRDHTKH
jgi:hypothetical protein